MADVSPNGEHAAAAWPTMGDAAYRGLAGAIVESIAPETEADPVALLADLLATFGNLVGGGQMMTVRHKKHAARVWPLIVGKTGDRKGQSRSEIQGLCRIVDPVWDCDRQRSGLSSGEGLIAALADDSDEDGEVDKRLLVIEEEFARVLKVCARDGNTLSENLRQAWDGETMRVMTKRPVVATNAHVTIIAHITFEELRTRLSQVDQANGFANRFLFFAVRRAQMLPEGGHLDMTEINRLATLVHKALVKARKHGTITRSAEAKEFWAPLYREFAVIGEGLRTALAARGDAQMLRLQLIYALLDGSPTVEVSHIESALAVWRYCEESVRYIFDVGAFGDRDLDTLFQAIADAGARGMTRTQQSLLFGRHRSSEELEAMRAQLERIGAIYPQVEETRGRPRETWVAK